MKHPKITFLFLFLGLLFLDIQPIFSQARPKDIPATHTNISVENGVFVAEVKGKKAFESELVVEHTLSQMLGRPKGTKRGIAFDFGDPELGGKLYYGFIPYGDSKHPLPVYFKSYGKIEGGKAEVSILSMKGRYDMIGWEKSGKGTLGYRVVDANGTTLYDGRVSFSGTGPFSVENTILEGPFVNKLSSEGATISFTTSKKVIANVKVGDQSFSDPKSTTQHEIAISGLEAAKKYDYTVEFESISQQFALKTAPNPGSRQPFVFSYASDSRSGQGGGERDIYGANSYIMKKIMALNSLMEVSFMQFSGDLINGYLTDIDETNLQYANWKRAVEPFWHYFPIYVSMGNHEALMRLFSDGRYDFRVDRFPYETESAEAIFNNNFVNPENGPISEDGASYDPDEKKMDFPPYKENVFYYTYDNVAVIVLNSDYFYAPSISSIQGLGGGLHGYIMDQQLAWLDETVASLEGDGNIDHIFLTLHTPFFPNGGHVGDDMWYRGNNQFRPKVADKSMAKGIIERRDQLLEILVNKSEKVVAILTGDEHNYARTEIGPETNIYPEPYLSSKIELKRTIHQVNNGAAGAPYYAQEQTPWSPFVSGFTTQNALVFFHVEGKKIKMVVRNPDTLELVDELDLR